MEEEKEFYSGNAGGLTIKEHLSKYLAYYPLFIISLIVCVGAGLIYLRYAIPKYRATALIFVKNDKKGTPNDLIETAITGTPVATNLDNEVELLNSSSLMERVVSKNGFNISYFHVGSIRKTDVYLDAPFRLIPQVILDSNNFLSFTLTKLSSDGGIIETGSSDKIKKVPFKWNLSLTLGEKSFLLVTHGDVSNNKSDYIVTWNPVRQTAAEISSKMDISLFSRKTSIIQLGITIENVNRGKDILNALSTEYNLSDIGDRNVVSQNTIRFINDRLNVVSAELSGVEGRLENYQGSKGLVDVNIQSSQSFANTNTLSQGIADLNLKQAVAKSIMDYFNKPNADETLVPSTLGLQDPTLAGLISNYNELQMRKQKEAPSLAENGIIMKDLNNQLNTVKGSILESLQNINRNLKQTENSLQQQNSQYRQFLSALPSNERAMQEIKRKQSITEGLYLYLLQRREEAAVSSTSSNVPNYKQIDPAKGYGPIEPNGTNIKMYSALLGLLLPFGIIYLRDALNDKIMTRKDIMHKLDIPIVGEVSHLLKKQVSGVTVMLRDIVGEEFRIIRTNLYFLLERKEKQVILVTSSLGSEGKSFVSMNLAAVLAIPGKRVALLEFDMRKPSIVSHLKISRSVGLNEYFSGKIKEVTDVYHVLEDLIPTLHIYPSGATPTYPADLFLSDKLPKLFETLKSQYDYIIIDSAPVGLVSDAMVLGQYSDIVLFLIRQRHTLKKQLEFINDISKAKKLTNIGIIFNDVKTGGKIGYYGYGQPSDKKYGYESNDKSKPKKSKKKKTELV
ncbi:MAG: polysaccharide biosynthesis tyrosine autokinase [Ignavibacteriaceae bacterium]